MTATQDKKLILNKNHNSDFSIKYYSNEELYSLGKPKIKVKAFSLKS